jgi:hypothetical protein
MAIILKYHTVTGKVQTTDATLTTLVSYPLPTNTVSLIEGHIMGLKTTNDVGCAMTIQTAVKNNAGTLTEIGAHEHSEAFKDDAVWDCEINISGLNILLQVKGKAGQTINWVGEFHIHWYTP